MTPTPEEFREKWHDYIEELERMKPVIDPDDLDELEETIDNLHSIVDDAARDFQGDQE